MVLVSMPRLVPPPVVFVILALTGFGAGRRAVGMGAACFAMISLTTRGTGEAVRSGSSWGSGWDSGCCWASFSDGDVG